MTDRIARNGRTYEAVRGRCDCRAARCDVAVMVPSQALEPPAGKAQSARQRAVVVHNLVQKRHILGYPEM